MGVGWAVGKGRRDGQGGETSGAAADDDDDDDDNDEGEAEGEAGGEADAGIDSARFSARFPPAEKPEMERWAGSSSMLLWAAAPSCCRPACCSAL